MVDCDFKGGGLEEQWEYARTIEADDNVRK